MMFAAEAPASGRPGGFAFSLVASAMLHAAIAAGFLALRPSKAMVRPDFYAVDLVAAAPSPVPSAGAVAPIATVPEVEKPVPPRPKTDEVAPVPTKSTPRRADRRATHNVSDTRVPRNTPAQTAGGGETGGTGADVANIKIEGIVFPFPGYLENIVRQIALRFRPPRWGPALRAEVMFLIRRDGTVDGFRFIQRSGSFTFDLEAQGAVESAAQAFGPLPAGFREDVLPVVFSFDPRLIR
jgi:periplasmic protein TonB